MKIQSLTGNVGYTGIIRDKEGQSGSKEDPGHQKSKQDSKPDSNENSASNPELEIQASLEKVDQAIEAFRVDPQTLANGLSASVIGQGPGLKVVLKDGLGGIVKQFTGEEFLKLHESSGSSSKSPGKILDRKL